jgi:hypothetical protein
MGVCCARNVDEPITRFIEKAAKERINIGKEEIFRRGISTIDSKRVPGLDLSNIKEIFTSQFVYNDQPDSYYYDFFIKDNLDKLYNVEINILKNTNYPPIYTFRELRDEVKQDEEVVDYMKYNTESIHSSPKKVNRTKVITIPKKDNDIFTEESKNNILSPPRLSALSTRNNDRFCSPIKSERTDIDTVLLRFKKNADRLGIPYGSDEYLIRAIGLIEKKNKVIIEIETDIFEYNESDKGIEYKFSFIESKQIRYVCDIMMDNEEDNVFLHKPNQKISQASK